MKRFIAAILSLALLCSLVPTAFAATNEAAQTAGVYTDTAGNWAESSIKRWSEAGVVRGQGNGKFNPSGNMTRAEAAQIFANLLKLSAKADISAFADVSADAWYADPIAKCVAAGIMKGTGANTADPTGELTREQMFVMAACALGVEPASTCGQSFADADQVASWAAGYINALVNLGVINGVDDAHIAPTNDIDRASVTAVMDRMIGTYANTNGTCGVAANGVTLVVAENVNLTGKAGKLPIILAGGNTKVDMSKVTGAANVVVETDKVDITGAPVGTNIKSDPKADVTANGKDVTTSSYTVPSTTTTTGGSGSSSSGGSSRPSGGGSSSGGSSSGGGSSSSKTKVYLSLKLENLVSDYNKTQPYKNEALTITLSVPADKADAYELPDTVTVTVNGKAVESVYNAKTGKISLTAAQVTGNIVITAAAKAKTVAPAAADVVAAPLSADAKAKDYAVTGTVAKDGTVNVTIKATSLTEHKNGADTLGYWVGFGMPVEGDASAYTYTVAEGTGKAAAVAGPKDRTITVDGKTYATIYLTADVTSYTVTQTKGEKTVIYKVTIDVTTKVPAKAPESYTVFFYATWGSISKAENKDTFDDSCFGGNNEEGADDFLWVSAKVEAGKALGNAIPKVTPLPGWKFLGWTDTDTGVTAANIKYKYTNGKWDEDLTQLVPQAHMSLYAVYEDPYGAVCCGPDISKDVNNLVDYIKKNGKIDQGYRKIQRTETTEDGIPYIATITYRDDLNILIFHFNYNSGKYVTQFDYDIASQDAKSILVYGVGTGFAICSADFDISSYTFSTTLNFKKDFKEDDFVTHYFDNYNEFSNALVRLAIPTFGLLLISEAGMTLADIGFTSY